MFPTIDKEKTGKIILQLMKQNNIAPMGLKEYLNLSCVQTVYHWLNGISIPSIDNLYAMSELFGVAIDDIVCGNREQFRISSNVRINSWVLDYVFLLRKELYTIAKQA